VFPDFWGQGCGHILWRRAEKDLARAKCREVSVWVLGANERARKFYEREGCQADPRANKDAHIGGVKLPEKRYAKQLRH
jgi:ribosomal protein S18 acetylase RimI-like enzyme